MEQSMPAVESGLVDLAGVSLEALRCLDGRILASSLAELLHRIDNPQASVSDYTPQHLD
ncbi:hypothetical protein AB0M29_27655 [Streptomyces sp. NPDC051976]|uniref:hypothetical protein n=1 Tax=Streptomyces sp. NPDC051976 TaxID=3154947 RepID=UPI0034342C15